MSIVASLDVPLRGDTSNIDAALSRTENRVKQFAGSADAGLSRIKSSFMSGSAGVAGSMGQIGASIQNATTRLPGFSMAAGVAMGAVSAMTSAAIGQFEALTAKITGAVSSMAAMGPTAARLGITTGALAGLQHGAALAGVSVEEVEHFFGKFQKSVAEATMGMGESGKAFASLNMEIGAFRDMNPIDLFAKFGDAVKDTGNAADKILIVDAIMGRGADRLIPLLTQGTAGLRKMTMEAAALGPVSGASIAKVTESVVAWRRVQEAVAGLGRTLAVQLAPTLTSVSEALERFVRSAKDLELSRETFSVLARGALYAAGAVLLITNPIGALVVGLGAVGVKMGLLSTSWDDIRDTAIKGVFMIEAAWEEFPSFLAKVAGKAAVAFIESINWLGERLAQFMNWLANQASQAAGISDRIKQGIADQENKRRKAINDADPGGVPLPMVGAFQFDVDVIRVALFPKIDVTPWKDAGDALGKAFSDKLAAKMDDFTKRLAGDKRLKELFEMAMFKPPGGWPDKLPDAGKPPDAVARSPAAMLAGSKEAFETIFGAGKDYQAQALAVANNQLAALREMLMELKKAKKGGPGAPRIGRADL